MQFTRSLVVCVLAIGIAWQLSAVLAQEKSADPVSPAKKESPEERRGILPNQFGKLGVNDKQRDQMYAIQREYEKKLDELRTEMKRLTNERDQKLEELLTPGQKLRLRELLEEAKRRSEKDSKPADKPLPQPQTKN